MESLLPGKGVGWESNLRVRIQLPVSQGLSMSSAGILATSALDVARKFSFFYNSCPVISAEDADIRRSRLALCIATRQVLINLLSLIGIEAPERM